MLAIELLHDMIRNMEGVGTIAVPYHINQIKEAVHEIENLTAKNKQLKTKIARVQRLQRRYERISNCLVTMKYPAKDIKQALAAQKPTQ